nr:hypothetical protein [uncultured Flavobacterium sp.]
MKAVYDYIIEINEKFKDHITLNSGDKLFVDKRFTFHKNANVLHKIKKTPIVNSLNIEKGTEVVIDPIIMHDFLDQDGTTVMTGNQVSITNNLFRVSQRNIYFVKDNQTQTFYSPNDYILAKKIEVKTEQLKSSFLFIPESDVKQFEKYKVVLHSSSISNKNLTKDSIATTNIDLGAPFYINEEEFLLFREKHFFAIN